MTNESALDLELDERPKGILVVEDDMMTRYSLASWFRLEGYRVYEAANVDDAIAILSSSIRIHLVITDIDMPGPLNGLQLQDHIKTTAPHIQVILASAREVDVGERDAAFFKKPYSLPRLTIRVASMLQGPGAEIMRA